MERLDDVAEVRLGRQRSPKNHSGSQMRAYIRAANVDWQGLQLDDVKMMNFTDAEMEIYRLEPGDLLLSEASGSPGEVGKPAIWSGEIEDCGFQNTLIRVRSRGPEPRYLMHFFRYQALAGRFADRSRGVGIHHLGRAALSAWAIPVPPLEEQRRIVEVLEDHLSRLDAGVSGLRRGAAHLPVLRLSALSATRRTLLERGAPLLPLSAIATTALGKMLDAKKAVGDPTPYLRNINVRWGAFNLDDVATVQLTVDERERLALRRGDLLVCEGGEPGRCAVWPGGDSLVGYQKALHRVRVLDSERTDVHFLAAMLEEFIRAGRADRMFTGTTIKHLTQEKLRLITIPMPGVAHQKAIVDRLRRLDQGASRLRADLTSQTARAGLLRRTLLDAAFSGRLLGRSSDMGRVKELAGV